MVKQKEERGDQMFKLKLSKKIISAALSSTLLFSVATTSIFMKPSISHAEETDNISKLLDVKAATYSKIPSTDLVYLNKANEELSNLDVKNIVGNDVITNIDSKTSKGTAEKLIKDLVAISYAKSSADYNKRFKNFSTNYDKIINSALGMNIDYLMEFYAGYQWNTGIYLAKGIDGGEVKTYDDVRRLSMETALDYKEGAAFNSDMKSALGLDLYELIDLTEKIHNAIDPKFEARAALFSGFLRSFNVDIYGKSALSLGVSSPYQIKVDNIDITNQFTLKTNNESIATFKGSTLKGEKEGNVRVYAYAIGIPVLVKDVKITPKDLIAPSAPVVNKVGDNDTVITGKTEGNATVTVKNGNKVVATGKSDLNGNFRLSLVSQKANSVLTITVKDESGNTSKATSVKVLDRTPPKPPIINKFIGAHGPEVSGTAEPGATLIIKKGSTVVAKGKATNKGTYSISIKLPKTKQTTYYVIYAVDNAGNKSSEVNFFYTFK
jgi:hypothetical protein